FRDQTGEVADAVVVRIKERLDVKLIDNGVLVPQRILRDLGDDGPRAGQGDVHDATTPVDRILSRVAGKDAAWRRVRVTWRYATLRNVRRDCSGAVRGTPARRCAPTGRTVRDSTILRITVMALLPARKAARSRTADRRDRDECAGSCPARRSGFHASGRAYRVRPSRADRTPTAAARSRPPAPCADRG